MIARPPGPALAPFVALLWASPAGRPGARERVLPTGLTHLALRLDGQPLRLYADAADAGGFTVPAALVGGPRLAAYHKDLGRPAPTVGVQFRAGGAACLLGLPPDALAGRHVALEDLWGADAGRLLDHLASEPDPARRLDRLERWLEARLAERLLAPAWLAPAARALAAGRPVALVAEAVGYGPRRFDVLFTRATGLGPKGWQRVRRFQGLLAAMRAEPGAALAGLATDAGYADQAHATREFGALAGVTPGLYRKLAPADANHVAEPIRNRQDRPGPACDAKDLKGGPRGHS